MPTDLPFAPMSATQTYFMRRRIFQSDFSGAVQQVVLQDRFYTGDFLFPPIVRFNQAKLLKWNKFVADVDDGDGTIWVPLYSDNHSDQTTGLILTRLTDKDQNTAFHASAGLNQTRVPEVGSLVRLYASGDEGVSYVRTVVGIADAYAVDEKVMLLQQDIPDNSDIDRVDFRAAKVRAIVINEDFQSLTLDASEGSVQPASIQWQEAWSHIDNDLNAL